MRPWPSWWNSRAAARPRPITAPPGRMPCRRFTTSGPWLRDTTAPLPRCAGGFTTGLFGPPEERRFRGRGYVATSDAVHDFEERTGLGPADVRMNIPVEADGAIVASPPELVELPKQSRSSDVRPRLGDKILAAAKRPPR